MYYRIITTIALVLATLGANAQATDEPVLLSLDECVRIALSDNPTIHINEMEIQRVKYSKKEIQGQLLPNINFTGQYNRTLAKQTMTMNAGDEPMTIKVGMDNQHSVGFNASMPLIMPTLWKSIKLSDNQILQNIENARANKLSLVNQVKNAYYALLLAQDSKNVIEENHATAQLNASIYQKQFELGTASEYDVLRANVAVTNLEPSILEAENYIDLLKLQLKVLMGMDVRTPIAPRQTLDEFKARMYDQSILADTSLVSNTSLRSLELKTDYLKRALDTQKMSWYPTLTASANYMWNSMSNGSPFKNFNWNPYSTVGLTLTLPLFQGGQRYYKQRQAEVALREMTWQRENLERSLKMQVQNQVDIINKTLKQISSNEGGVRQATKANDIVQQSFKIGAASFIQLRDTEDALMNARLSYYQAIYNYLVAECDLEYLLGNTHYVAK
ncbi:MAG: TolC family protein [Muribaculaceae bacterium]|nr:TolC family protein [Muribaculaceae bacterium]